MASVEAAQVLSGLGFTGLESEVYAFLVRESPATGYRVAQAINKPVANTYKAIQSLQAKGAVEVEDGESRRCRAVPHEELLDRLGREFEAKRKNAKDFLGSLGAATTDDRVYQLRSVNQVLQRAREMLTGAEQVVLAVVSSVLLTELSDAFLDAATRGVDVRIKTEADVPIARAEVSVALRKDDLVVCSPHPTLRLAVDGKKHLAAVVQGSEAQAIFTQSPALALMSHEGIASELALLVIAERLEEGAGPKRLAKALGQIRPAASTLGIESL